MKKITRRNFLIASGKTVGTLAAASAFMGCASPEQAENCFPRSAMPVRTDDRLTAIDDIVENYGVIAGYPMQTVIRFSRCGARFGNKKSPHNNLNLTILSGMALVRVRYVAIRKSKTCSGSFENRARTLSKYVILNCWDRLPQKSSRVNKMFREHATFGRAQENTSKTLVKR